MPASHHCEDKSDQQDFIAHDHDHHHSHIHSHSGMIDVSNNTEAVEANRQHFNAHGGDILINRITQRAAALCANAIKDAVPEMFDEESPKTFMIDYACGLGLVAQDLASGVGRILGVDISEAMVQEFNTRVYNQGIPSEEMSAVLVKDVDSHLASLPQKADLVICCQSYHHFPDISGITFQLAGYLRPGGKIVIIDLLRPDSSKPSSSISSSKSDSTSTTDVTPLIPIDESDGLLHHAVVHKGGFTIEGLKAVIEHCNLLEDVTVEPSFTISYEEIKTLKPAESWQKFERMAQKYNGVNSLIVTATRKA